MNYADQNNTSNESPWPFVVTIGIVCATLVAIVYMIVN